MNADNLSALTVGLGVVALIVGFGVYFNSPELNNAASGQQKSFVPAAIIEDNGTITRLQIDKSQFKLAPELTKIAGFVNSEPITLADLRGKVVVVDFWTYSCINCIRTISYLNTWYEKYEDNGLVIVGVHTPEFEFEKDYNNVRAAVEKFDIRYPIAQDNEKETWKAYENRYWPRKYLIDPEGYKPDQVVKYTIPGDTQIVPNRIYLDGEWKNNADHMELQSEVGRVVLSYSAKAVNIVAGGKGELNILEDDSPLGVSLSGRDISEDGTVKIDGQRLYNVVEHEGYGKHQIAIKVAGRGFQIHTFTFG